ncbi:hypothetical protein vseg_014229 [Gypsophila vaccaria]
MEYFIRTKYFRLKNLHQKYLVAGRDGVSIKQSRNGDTIQAYWFVEMVEDGSNLIRLRSCHGKYLTASDEPFLLGWTGDKVLQTSVNGTEPSVLWEPSTVSDHPYFIRLRTPLYDKFLRANGGARPWKKSVTVDVPESLASQYWILWCVDALDDLQSIHSSSDLCLWPRISDSEDLCSSCNEDDQSSGLAGGSSPISSVSSAAHSITQKSVTLDLHNAKTIRLRSHRNKYLMADEDGETVSQRKHGGSKRAYWTVEHMKSAKGGSSVRLMSSYQKYLTATDDNFLLGATGKKVKQTMPKRLDYSIEWELVGDGNKVKLRTWDGNFLRANGGVPPWRNSVTHDHPSISPTKDKLIWEVEVIDVYDN